MKECIKIIFITVILLIANIALAQINNTNENLYLPISGQFLGQKPPAKTPELFAPGIICTGMDERDIAISPDGNEIFYGVLEEPHYVLVWLRIENGTWKSHEIAPFSGLYNDYEPQFSPDGNRLYFCSDRPLNETGDPKDSDIWYVERIKNGWSEAKNLGPPVNTEKNEFYPSLTVDGTLYFTSHDMKICKSKFVNGKYNEPETLSDSINTRAEYNAFIDPNEKYLIFTSHSWGYAAGRGDLFISYKINDSTWTKPIHLGDHINSNAMDMSPSVSFDGKYLFFSSMRTIEEYNPISVKNYQQLFDQFNKPQNKKFDIYWIEADIIDELRPKLLEN